MAVKLSEKFKFGFNDDEIKSVDFGLNRIKSLISKSSHFIAGGTSGIAMTFCGHPLDLVRVQLQSGYSPNIIHCLKTTFQSGGMRALFSGMSLPLYSVTFINAATFSIYNKSIKMFEKKFKNKSDESILVSFCASLVTGGSIAFLHSPTELIKNNMQAMTQLNGSPSLTKIINKIYNNYGIRAFMHGTGITVARNVVGYPAYFMLYNYLKNKFDKMNMNKTSNILLASSIAGVSFSTVIHPIDTVKSVLQLQVTKNGSYNVCMVAKVENGLVPMKSEMHPLTDAKTVAKQIFKDFGWYGFFRGLLASLFRAVPANIVCFMVYEHTLQIMEN